MNKMIATLAGLVLAIGFVACDSTNSTNDTIVTDQPAVCTVTPATTVQASCTQYLDVLCARHVACGTYSGMDTCTTWFNTNYGNCVDAPTTALTAAQQASQKTCACDLPTASCVALSADGAEATVPACGEF